MPPFRIHSDFVPRGDQPSAIDAIVEELDAGAEELTLLGVTGSGKTFTMANIIERTQRTTLVLTHNKTLAAQLFSEFKDFFPENAVEYFVSYYDYYLPESYIPQTDTYIDKEVEVSEELTRLRLSTTASLLTRRDVIVVASVSCIFGLGSPEDLRAMTLVLSTGQRISRGTLLRELVEMQYERTAGGYDWGCFRVTGDTIDIFMPEGGLGIRIELFGDILERLTVIDPLTGDRLKNRDHVLIYPAKHFVTPPDKMEAALSGIEAELEERLAELRANNKLLEAQRLEQRTQFDLEMLRETGYCKGIENYSRFFSGRRPGESPYTLLDFFSDDFILFVDESHVTLPQVSGMYKGDRSRKETLVEYGFRLPSALDNRPLQREEFHDQIDQAVYVSATPTDYEREHSALVVTQIIRPTGLVDPIIAVKPSEGQVDDLMEEIRIVVDRNERILVTTLTKRMAEDLCAYYTQFGIRTRYLHSEIDTLERVEILRELRAGAFDVLIGINLLREGLDLPEVSLVAILDADKQGFLRSETALIQTIGRASRNIHGRVVMYANRVTPAMDRAITITRDRREQQLAFNRENDITPQTINKRLQLMETGKRREATLQTVAAEAARAVSEPKTQKGLEEVIAALEKEMKERAKALEFEEAAELRDLIFDYRAKLDTGGAVSKE